MTNFKYYLILPLYLLFHSAAIGQIEVLRTQAFDVFQAEAFENRTSTTTLVGWLQTQNATTGAWPTNDIDYYDVSANGGWLQDFDHSNGNTLNSNQSSTFVGASSNGRYGVTAMVYDKDGISGKKSWFQFGEEVVALGAGISGSDALHTTIDQSRYSGSHTVDDGSSNTKWVQHNGISYILPDDPVYFPSGQSWTFEGLTKFGNWNLINGDEDDDDDDEPASGPVLTGWIDHTGANADSYYYIVAPGQDAETYAQNNPITVLQNTASTQAIKKDNGLAGIIYYQGATPDYVAVTDHVALKTNYPCALLFDGNTGEVCISSPDRMYPIIELEIQQTIGTDVTMSTVQFIITVMSTSLSDNSSLFKMEFKALTDYTRSSASSYKLSDLISLNDMVLANEAYSERGKHKVNLVFVAEDYFNESTDVLLNTIKCYPNPVQSEISFSLDLRNASNATLQIFDPTGKLVIAQEYTLPRGNQIITIDNVEKWEKGMYFYSIKVGDETESGKFVK